MKTIFNRRTTNAVDLTEDDVAAGLEPLDMSGTVTIFVALSCMYGTKVGAMKHCTGHGIGASPPAANVWS